MTTKNEPLYSIQARIEELQNTIAEKEEQIKSRALHLSENIKAELAPMEIVKKYPFQATGITFVSAILLIRTLSGRKSTTSPEHPDYSSAQSQQNSALYTIGLDVLRSAKDLGFSYLKRYIDSKIK
jgi:hypothetical protein